MVKKVMFLVMRIPEADFYIKMVPFLKSQNVLPTFVSCHQAASKKIRKHGLVCYDIFEVSEKSESNDGEVVSVEKKFKIPNIREIYFRESVQFNIRDEKSLVLKTIKYLNAMDQILKEASVDIVMQETGDFIAPLSLYYASRKNKVVHVSIEPAMFKRRMVFCQNALFADIPQEIMNTEIKKEYLDFANYFIDEYKRTREVRMPEKDKAFFLKMEIRDLLSLRKIKSLLRKLTHKYLTKEKEEYNAIFNHCKVFLNRIITRKKMKRLYTRKIPKNNYVYFPLHVPFDLQLTTRCNDFFDQITLIEYIARKLPYGWTCIVKEHPASIGMYPYNRIKQAILNNANIKILDPSLNSFDIISSANAVVTINSKAGVEAVVQGKPVIVLGKTFYREKGITIDIGSLDELSEAFQKVKNGWLPDSDNVAKFLAQVYLWAVEGELFGFSEDSCEITANSIVKEIKRVLRSEKSTH